MLVIFFRDPTPVKEELLENITWPCVNSSKVIFQFQIDSDLKLIQNYRWMYVEFWEKLYKQYGHEPYLTY